MNGLSKVRGTDLWYRRLGDYFMLSMDEKNPYDNCLHLNEDMAIEVITLPLLYIRDYAPSLFMATVSVILEPRDGRRLTSNEGRYKSSKARNNETVVALQGYELPNSEFLYRFMSPSATSRLVIKLENLPDFIEVVAKTAVVKDNLQIVQTRLEACT